MECQIFQWLIAGAGPTTLQHALVGIGCLLAVDAWNRWRQGRKNLSSEVCENRPEVFDHSVDDYRQAA